MKQFIFYYILLVDNKILLDSPFGSEKVIIHCYNSTQDGQTCTNVLDFPDTIEIGSLDGLTLCCPDIN